MSNTVSLFFPSNRFEDPAWLNINNLLNKPTYLNIQKSEHVSNRSIINYSPLRENQNWLLDLIYDRFALERISQMVNVPQTKGPLPLMVESYGVATTILGEVERFMSNLFQANLPITWKVGLRGNRQISVIGENKLLTNSLFSLSTGQTILLDIFLTLIRDFDLSDGKFDTLEDIKGIVVIDEVDLHLHAEFQHTILPELIALFPKVQFIMTSHSPLFLLGLRNTLGDDKFDVIELPSVSFVDVEQFSEFEFAYDFFKDSESFQRDLMKEIEQIQNPVLFTEGKTDIRYLEKAADFLGQKKLLKCFTKFDAEGFGGLDKIWNVRNTKLLPVLTQKIVLLYGL